MDKILITGLNKAQCTKDFFLNQVLKVVPSHYALIRTLEDLGFEVEQRPAVLGEDLSSYKHVIVYMHSPQAFCQNLYTGLYALSQRPDAILAFDDWQVDQIYAGIKGILVDFEEDGDRAFREYLLAIQDQKYPAEIVKKYKQQYAEACRTILSKNNKLLISSFGGGDLNLLNLEWDMNQVHAFNPNPYHYNRNPDNNFMSGTASVFGSEVDPEDKLLEWNFASLVQKKTKKWLANQHITWKINFYGQMKGPEKNERLTEDQMCAVYAAQWGCLMPGYFHSGSGWWRARPLQVADAGSILIGEKKELMIYYNDERLSSAKCSDIEAMDLSQLTQFAKDQRDALYANHPLDKSVTREEIRKIIEA